MVIFIWKLLLGRSSRIPQEQLPFSTMVPAGWRKPHSAPKLGAATPVRTAKRWRKPCEQSWPGVAGAALLPAAAEQAWDRTLPVPPKPRCLWLVPLSNHLDWYPLAVHAAFYCIIRTALEQCWVCYPLLPLQIQSQMEHWRQERPFIPRARLSPGNPAGNLHNGSRAVWRRKQLEKVISREPWSMWSGNNSTLVMAGWFTTWTKSQPMPALKMYYQDHSVFLCTVNGGKNLNPRICW